MNTLLMLAVWASSPGLAGNFVSDLSADADAIRVAHPAVAERVDEMAPIENRAGMWFFPGRDLVEDSAQVLIADRLLDGADREAVAVALAYALDTRHRMPQTVIKTQVPAVRAALLSGYKKVGDGQGLAVFEAALVDGSIQVRMEAVRLVGYRSDLRSPALSAGLGAALSDASPQVRAFSVRSMSWRGEQASFGAICGLLDDTSGAVRGAAVRALGKLDLARAAGLPAIIALSADPDPKVKRAVSRVLSP